jgi:hypothetical protein
MRPRPLTATILAAALVAVVSVSPGSAAEQGAPTAVPGQATQASPAPSEQQERAQEPAYGPGMMGGYGPGMMGGYGPGMMGGYGPGMMGGYGPGMMGGGYGRGWMGNGGYGPNMMASGCGPWMMGPAMMGAYGRGMMGGDAAGMMPWAGSGRQAALNLTPQQVKTQLQHWLAWRGNPHLKVGPVKEKDADTVTADIVTKDNSLVQRYDIDRHTGAFYPAED